MSTEKLPADAETHIHHHGFRGIVEDNTQALQNLAREGDAHPIHPEKDLYKIPFEEFLYFAKIQREYEESDQNPPAPNSLIPGIDFVISKFGGNKSHVPAVQAPTYDEKSDDVVHKVNANRALRNASWVTVFYLITTDILGPTSAPYSVSQLGFVPGALIYFLLGIAAAYCGFMLWSQFLKVDSAHYPIRNYGDLAGRILGRYFHLFVDVLQSVQLICNVAVIILGNGQGLSQIAQNKVCFAVLVIVWALAGMIVGQIRSLQRFGFLANLSIWMNLFVCFATMGVCAHTLPNYVGSASQNGTPLAGGPVITHIVVSGSGNFNGQLQATMNVVYAYGGAMVFLNFMAEMRRPWDFWKGMAVAQSVIFVCYLMFGLFVYAYQGQFVMNPANQGLSPYNWQTATNVLSLVSALIAAGLYGNVGVKCVYQTFVQRIFNGPPLEEGKKGRLVWTVLVLIYWALAYVIASAIPAFSSLTGLVGAICILQFSYTFPPIMQLGLDMQLNAMLADGPYDHINKITNRVDTWRHTSRWLRAYRITWLKNTFHLLVFFASLATAALGIYGSAESLVQTYASSQTVSFGCASPVG
jgi:hypothetical protein